MGKAKRLEKLESKKYKKLSRNLNCLYRFFEKEEWALQFIAGNIKVSTLTKCRAYDDPQQGDPDEAKITFHIKERTYNGRNLSSIDRKELEHIGAFVDETSTLIINNGQFSQSVSDAFILCTTADLNDIRDLSKSWKFGVKISLPPNKLHELLNSAFEREGVDLRYSKHRFVDYDTERFYSDVNKQPSDIAFIKPKHQKDQKEYRFLWSAENSTFDYSSIDFIYCPEISEYCELV